MALFEGENDKLRPDLNSQALSVIALENDFVEGVYEKLSTVYDVFFGPILHPGRLLALQRMDIQPGARVLEVGVGTGISSALYPHNCHVTAIDFSAPMLAKARRRVSRKQLLTSRSWRWTPRRSRLQTSRSTSSTRRTL